MKLRKISLSEDATAGAPVLVSRIFIYFVGIKSVIQRVVEK
jgi:hypothetical protein